MDISCYCRDDGAAARSSGGATGRGARLRSGRRSPRTAAGGRLRRTRRGGGLAAHPERTAQGGGTAPTVRREPAWSPFSARPVRRAAAAFPV